MHGGTTCKDHTPWSGLGPMVSAIGELGATGCNSILSTSNCVKSLTIFVCCVRLPNMSL